MVETQGLRIRKIRLQLNLSQEEFGRIFGITKQYVYSLEKDKMFLNNEKLVKLLVDYNVNINYLLVGVGEMFLTDDISVDNSVSSVEKNIVVSQEELRHSNGYTELKQDILDEVKSLLKSEGVIK